MINKIDKVKQYFFSVLLGLVISLNIPNVVAFADVISQFSFNSAGKLTGDKLVEYGDKDGYMATSGKGNLLCFMDNSGSRALEWSDPEYNGNALVPIIRASDKNQWGSVPAFIVSCSTKGYGEIKFDADMAGSSNGPGCWKLQYSLDGSNYIDIGSSDIAIDYSTRKTMTSYYSGFSLPKEAENQSILYLKIISTSTKTIVGGDYTNIAFGGEIAINNITISGTDVNLLTTAPQSTQATSSQVTVPSDEPTNKPTSADNKDTVVATTKGDEEKPTTSQSSTSNKTSSSASIEKKMTNNNNTIKITDGSTEQEMTEAITHIITEINPSGETITKVEVEYVEVATAASITVSENETTTSEEQKETVSDKAELESTLEKKSNSKKEKDSSDSNKVSEDNIDNNKILDSKENDNSTVIILVLVGVLAAGILGAFVLQKVKNKEQ